MQHLFTVARMAKELDVKEAAVRYLIDSHDIPAAMQLGKTRAYSPDVLAWVKWEIEKIPAERRAKVGKLRERATG